MNIEQKRDYYENLAKLSDTALLKESKKVNWRLNLTAGAILAEVITIVSDFGYALSQNKFDQLEPLIILTGAVGALYFTSRKNSEYIQRANLITHNFRRRNMGLNLSMFYKIGLGLVSKYSSQKDTQ